MYVKCSPENIVSAVGRQMLMARGQSSARTRTSESLKWSSRHSHSDLSLAKMTTCSQDIPSCDICQIVPVFAACSRARHRIVAHDLRLPDMETSRAGRASQHEQQHQRAPVRRGWVGKSIGCQFPVPGRPAVSISGLSVVISGISKKAVRSAVSSAPGSRTQ